MCSAKALTRAASALLCVGLMGSACTLQSSAAPTSPAAGWESPPSASQTSVLTVRVLARGSEQPIAGAQVWTSTYRTTTGADGLCALTVARGEEMEVSVSAPGYQPMGASGVLGGDERWTFYLPGNHESVQ